MYKLMILAVLAGFWTSAAAQDSKSVETEKNMLTELPENSFDQALAEEVGADEYGMKQYVMAFLKRGPNRDFSQEEAMKLQRAHLDNIGRLAKEGKLVVAGPFMDDGDIRGIYIFNVTSLEEAKSLTETDPAIIAGSLEMELRPWYGSAGLMKVGEIHQKVAKKAI